jgi:TonB family protein
MSVHTANSGASPERRLHARQRIDTLVYLDIGADNGGIVLNLSDEGLRFQAVGPLDKQSELRLRIKIPGSKTRIDVTAQIAWLSDSKRQAGVRFLDIQPGGSVQIQEWIRSQASPRALWEESSKQIGELTASKGKPETIRELPTDNSLSSMSAFDPSELSRPKPPENGSSEMRHRIPAPRETAAFSEKPKLGSEPLAEPAQSPTVELPALREESLPAAGVPSALEAAVIPDQPELISEPFAESSKSSSVERPATQEESLQAAAVPVAREAAVISEKREPVSEPVVESAKRASMEHPALREESLLAAAVLSALEAALIPEQSELISEPIAKSAKSASVEHPARREESLQAVAVPVAREAAAISEKRELVSEPLAESAKSASVGPPALQEESSQVAAVPTALEAAVIPERPELISESFPEPAQSPTVERPALQEESLQAAAVPVAREAVVIPEQPELISEPIAEATQSPTVERPALEEESSQATAFQDPDTNASSEPDGGDASIAATSHEESSGESMLDWPALISRTVTITIPRRPDAPPKPVERFASAGPSKTNSTPNDVNGVLAAPAATDRMLLWNQIAIAVFFVVCAVLCFGIGTWVGQIVTRRNSSSAAVAPVHVVPTAEPGANVGAGNAGSNAARPAPARAETVHTGPSSAHSALENRQVVPSVSSPDIIPVPQSAPSNPPAEQNVTVVAAKKVQEAISPVVPAPENPPAPAPSPRIVAGLTLKPSDRFNPCYLSYRVEPVYPPEAQKQQIEGVVKIQQVVGTDGRVRSVKLLSGPPLLVTAALEAARYWRYLPALLNGQPVETEQDVEINFRLPY